MAGAFADAEASVTVDAMLLSSHEADGTAHERCLDWDIKGMLAHGKRNDAIYHWLVDGQSWTGFTVGSGRTRPPHTSVAVGTTLLEVELFCGAAAMRLYDDLRADEVMAHSLKMHASESVVLRGVRPTACESAAKKWRTSAAMLADHADAEGDAWLVKIGRMSGDKVTSHR